MRQDDLDKASTTRADLEARLRALEAKREQLIEQITAQRLETGDRSERSVSEDTPASMLRILDGALHAMQPILGKMTSARETLLAERAEAELRSDIAGASEVTTMLDELQVRVEEFRTSMAQLKAAADTIRVTTNGAATDATQPNEAS